MRWVIVILYLLVLTQPVAAALKKCVDDAGDFYYYDKILPAECQGKVTVEMNKQGVVIKRNEVAQHVPQPVIDKVQSEEIERQRKEKERQDNVLLNTYTGVDEIEWAKTRNIEPVELAIIGIKKRLGIARSQLNMLQEQAKKARESKSPILAAIKEDMAPVKRDVRNLRDELIAHEKKIDSIRMKFETDKKRFLELQKNQ